MGSVVPWLTFRGLHTDRLEVFSADHRLTFRGLSAEGLGVETRETPSSSAPPAGTPGVLGLPPQEGLSWAAHGTANRDELVLEVVAATRFPVSDLGCGSAAIGLGEVVLETVLLGEGCRTVLIRSSIPIPRAGVGASSCLAARCGIYPLQGAG